MRIAGIDPSLSNFGMAKGYLQFPEDGPQFYLENLQLQESKSDKANAKVVRKNSDDLNRAKTLHDALHQFIDDVELVIVEVPVGSQSARSMASYGICIGLLASIGTPMIQVTPTEVKIAATGRKTASKAEMIDWATNYYPDANWLRHKQKGQMVLGNKNEHLADAVGAVFAGIATDTFNQMLAFRSSLRSNHAHYPDARRN